MKRSVLAAGLMVAALLGPGFACGAAGASNPRDLQALIDAAEPGSELRLAAGTYRGGVVIDKPLRVVGDGWPVVDGGGQGSVIEVEAPDVRIEGLVIRDTGILLDREDSGVKATKPRVRIVHNRFEGVLFGANLREAPDSLIADNTFHSKAMGIARRGDLLKVWESGRTRIERNNIIGGRDAVMWFSDGIEIRDNHFIAGRYGLHFMYAHDAILEGNEFRDNSVGVFLMFSHGTKMLENVIAGSEGPSGYAIGFKDCDGAEIEGNRLVGNRVGIYLDGSPFGQGVYQHFRNNVIAYNDVGVEFLPSVEHNVFTENAFLDNRQQVSVNGGGFVAAGNEWSADGVGNHWSDYAGYDGNGDGVGDIEYRADDLFSDLTDRHPKLTFFAETPAARAVDLAAQAFPVFRPDPKAVDPEPLVGMPSIPPSPIETAGPSRLSLALASATMLAVAVFLVHVSGSCPRARRARMHP